MTIYFYKWKLHPGKEAQFKESWEYVTKELLEKGGSLGSRLHIGSDGLWYGYAQWPSREHRGLANLDHPEVIEARARMTDAICESYPETILETVADHLAPTQLKPNTMRVARSTNNLELISGMYKNGFGFEILGSFKNHKGFDGVVLGKTKYPYHLEFTHHPSHPAPRCQSNEDLLVFYLPDTKEHSKILGQALNAGFIKVPSLNPYWDENGVSLEDLEGYRVVLCHREWKI